MLCVFSSEDHISGFDKILCHKTIRSKYQGKMKVKLSTYENFLEEKLEDHYDFVLMIFMDIMSGDDLEIQADHYSYYSSVPIVHWAVANKVMNSNSYDDLRSFVKDNLEQRIIDPTPIVLDDATASAAESLNRGFQMLIDAYENKKHSEVKQAFSQFDADNSGAIDKEELQMLSAQLGAPLNEE